SGMSYVADPDGGHDALTVSVSTSLPASSSGSGLDSQRLVSEAGHAVDASFRTTTVNPSIARASDLATLLAGRDWSDNHATGFATAPTTGRQVETARLSTWGSLPQAAGTSSN